MTEPLELPAACAAIQDALLADPLAPGATAEAHLASCRACAEARIAFLAQEESPVALAPAGYFERLPGRITRKLPARPRLHQRLSPFTWATAAALLLSVGGVAFWAGRANRTPVVQAALPQATSEPQEITLDMPFDDPEDALSQLADLPQQDAEAVLQRLRARHETRPQHP